MKAAIGILACSLFVSIPAIAALVDGARLYDGANIVLKNKKSREPLEVMLESRFSGYVIGVIDGSNTLNNCLPIAVTVGQLTTIAAKYIVNHDEKRHLPAPDLIVLSMVEAFPDCDKKFLSGKKE